MCTNFNLFCCALSVWKLMTIRNIFLSSFSFIYSFPSSSSPLSGIFIIWMSELLEWFSNILIFSLLCNSLYFFSTFLEIFLILSSLTYIYMHLFDFIYLPRCSSIVVLIFKNDLLFFSKSFLFFLRVFFLYHKWRILVLSNFWQCVLTVSSAHILFLISINIYDFQFKIVESLHNCMR